MEKEVINDYKKMQAIAIQGIINAMNKLAENANVDPVRMYLITGTCEAIKEMLEEMPEDIGEAALYALTTEASFIEYMGGQV